MVQLQEVIKSHFGWWEMSQATQFRQKAVSIAPILPWDFWALTYLLLPSNQILYLSLFSLPCTTHPSWVPHFHFLHQIVV